MSDVMLSLGEYQFSVDTAAYEQLCRRSEYRWARMERISHRPSLQYVGMGLEEIELRGVIYPHYKGGLGQIDSMREEAAKGKPLILVSGNTLGRLLSPHRIVQQRSDERLVADTVFAGNLAGTLDIPDRKPDSNALCLHRRPVAVFDKQTGKHVRVLVPPCGLLSLVLELRSLQLDRSHWRLSRSFLARLGFAHNSLLSLRFWCYAVSRMLTNRCFPNAVSAA
jgi:hypothetical protein